MRSKHAKESAKSKYKGHVMQLIQEWWTFYQLNGIYGLLKIYQLVHTPQKYMPMSHEETGNQQLCLKEHAE